MFKAICKDNGATVAIKILKLEDTSINLDDIRKEVLTMKLCNNDNVLTCYSCFNVGCSLWIITPLMTKGSFLRILQYLREHKRVQEGQGLDVAISFLASNLGIHRRLHHPRSSKGIEVPPRLQPSPSVRESFSISRLAISRQATFWSMATATSA